MTLIQLGGVAKTRFNITELLREKQIPEDTSRWGVDCWNTQQHTAQAPLISSLVIYKCGCPVMGCTCACLFINNHHGISIVQQNSSHLSSTHMTGVTQNNPISTNAEPEAQVVKPSSESNLQNNLLQWAEDGITNRAVEKRPLYFYMKFRIIVCSTFKSTFNKWTIPFYVLKSRRTLTFSSDFNWYFGKKQTCYVWKIINYFGSQGEKYFLQYFQNLF